MKFSTRFQLLHEISIEDIQHLDFVNIALNGTYQLVKIEPEDSGAVVFNAKGIPNSRVHAYIRNGSGVMYRVDTNSKAEADLIRFSDLVEVWIEMLILAMEFLTITVN